MQKTCIRRILLNVSWMYQLILRLDSGRVRSRINLHISKTYMYYEKNTFMYSAYFGYMYHGWNTSCFWDLIRGALTIELCIGIVHQIWSARVQPTCVVYTYNYHQLRSVRIQSDSECTYIHMRTAWKHPNLYICINLYICVSWYMHMYLYVCINIYINIYTYICIYIYTCIHICIYIHIHIHMYVYKCTYVYTYVYIHMCIYLYIFMNIYMLYLYVCVYICT